jgi:FMN phosphatase YigB (HAD superfamily)
MDKFAAVFFDFDGVLCTDRFYTTLLPDYPQVVDWISAHVFSGEKYCDNWMRGELNWHDINNIIARATTVSPRLLDERLLSSVRKMTVNPALMQFAEALKQKGVKVALVTSNMDVFNEITVPEKHLDETFPVIANSYDYKLMKHDENGRLFDIALRRLGLRSYEGVLLIDDSPICCDIFIEKGGEAYRYTGLSAFEEWSKALIT